MRLPLIQLALALVVLLNAAISLEDPFDNVGLDGIYIDEAWSDVQQVGLAVACMSLHSDMFSVRYLVGTLQAMAADDGEVNDHISGVVGSAWPAAASNGV